MWRLEMSTKKQKVRTALDTLRLFNEKADELRASPYIKQLPNQEWAIHFDNTTGEEITVDIRPDDESRKALILTLRFFENELKLKNVVELYEDLPIPIDQKRSVGKSLDTFESALASGLQFIVKVNNTTYTSKEIFKTFMYGQYCHPEEPLRERLKVFKESQISWMMVNQEFDQTISLYLRYIFWLYNKNVMAIKALEASGSA